MSEQDFNPTPEKPILMNTEMVRAIMNGTKTQTRRVADVLGKEKFLDLAIYHQWLLATSDHDSVPLSNELAAHSPFGKSGTLLWVRETFQRVPDTLKTEDVQPFLFKADNIGKLYWKWKPSIHMPKDAARIWLMVADVRIERLQDMGDDDAIAEGVLRYDFDKQSKNWSVYSYHDYCDSTVFANTALDSFRSLWQSIYDKRGLGWQKNPWVWVYTFEVLSTTGKPETWPGKQLNVVEEAAKYRHP
jgi:hypothetical protein